MNIIISVPDVFGGNRDVELRILSFLIRKNFPVVKDICFRLEPRVNEFGFENFAQVSCLYFTKMEKILRIYETSTNYIRQWLLRYANPVYISLTNSIIFLRRQLGIRCHQDMFYVVGNPKIEYQIAGFIQSILLLRMPDATRGIIDHGDDDKQQYSAIATDKNPDDIVQVTAWMRKISANHV